MVPQLSPYHIIGVESMIWSAHLDQDFLTILVNFSRILCLWKLEDIGINGIQ